VVAHKSKILQNLLRPILPAAIMGVCVWAAQAVLKMTPFGSSRILSCGVPVAVGVVVYAVGIVIFKAIRREDCMLLPKGDKISQFLHL
jgi:hypothetical protein